MVASSSCCSEEKHFQPRFRKTDLNSDTFSQRMSQITMADSIFGSWLYSGKQVTNLHFTLMDLTTIARIADTPSWSLVTCILSTSLAAERSMSRYGDTHTHTRSEEEDSVSEQGPAVDTMKGFTKFSHPSGVRPRLNPTICRRWSPVRRHGNVRWQPTGQPAASPHSPIDANKLSKVTD